MADENVSKEKRLFDLLNQKQKELKEHPAHIAEIQRTIAENPDILKSPEFLGYITSAPNKTKTLNTVGGNLHHLEKEGKLPTIHNPRAIVAKAIEDQRQSPEPVVAKAIEDQRQSPEPVVTKTIEDQRQSPEPARGNVTIESAQEAVYRGQTLTVEQQELLKNDNAKKVADFENTDGDKNKSPKREGKGEKFRDEDIVKYLYEQWLNLNSWVFDKAEALVLNSVDYFWDTLNSKKSNKKKKTSERAKAFEEKVDDFRSAMANNAQSVKGKNRATVAHFGDVLTELKNNLVDNPDNANWSKLDPNSEIVKKLKENPQKAQAFIAAGTGMLSNASDNIDMIYTLATTLTSVEMMDEAMRKDSHWRGLDGEYKETSILGGELHTRSLGRQNKLMEAIAVTAEDARLLAEIAYDQLPDNQRQNTDRDRFISLAVRHEVSEFIQDVTTRATALVDGQRKQIDNSRYDANDDSPSKAVRDGLRRADLFIEERINRGKMFNEQEFTSSKARVEGQVGLLQALAAETNDSQSVMKNIDAHLADLSQQRAGNDDRRARLAATKQRIDKRDKSKVTDHRIQAMTSAALQQMQQSGRRTS